MGIYFRDILLIRISRGANNCGQHSLAKNIYFIMRFSPHFQLFYFNDRLEFCEFIEWKIKRINNADLFSQPPLLIFIKGANISGGHCILQERLQSEAFSSAFLSGFRILHLSSCRLSRGVENQALFGQIPNDKGRTDTLWHLREVPPWTRSRWWRHRWGGWSRTLGCRSRWRWACATTAADPTSRPQKTVWRQNGRPECPGEKRITS